MPGEKDLSTLLKTMKPVLNHGLYVFSQIDNIESLDLSRIISFFREKEGYTIILEKEEADRLQLNYTFVAGWITLTVHSSLDAVGLTAAFSNALSEKGISCNVIAGFFHDHIFVSQADVQAAMSVLQSMSDQNLP